MTYEQKKIIESSTFNLLSVYLNFFLGLLSTYSIARIITPEEWGFLLLAESFISTTVFFSSLFPPGAEGSIDYYIPHLKSLNGNRDIQIRKFIFHNYKLRSLSSLVGFFVFLIILMFSNLDLTLYQITLLISPKIILNLIQNLNIATFTGFQKFKLMFASVSIHTLTVSIGNFLLLLINPPNSILFVALISLIGLLIPTIISLFYVITLIPAKKVRETNQKYSHYKDFYKLHKTYGLPLVFTGIIAQLGNLGINLIFLAFGVIQYITYLSICERAVTSSLKFSSSDRSVQTSIFAEINYDKNPEKFSKIFYQFFKYMSVIVCLFTGLFYYLIKVYISVIYTDVYLVILFIVQIYLFQTFSRLINRNLLVLIYSTNNTRISTYYIIIQTVNNFVITYIGLAFFDLTTLVILYLLASYILNLLTIVLIKKIVGFNIKLRQVYYPFIIYLASFIITLPISIFMNFQPFQINLFNDILNGGLNFLIFLIIFYILIYLTKFITSEEINQIMEILPIGKLKNQFLTNIIKHLIKLFPSKEKKKKPE